MKVDHEIAIPYAQHILRLERSMSQLLLSRLDFSQGRFEATADFYAETPERWQITEAGWNSTIVTEYDDEGRPRRFIGDFAYAVADKMHPCLNSETRTLVIETPIAAPTGPSRPYPDDGPVRRFALETELGYEEYVVLPGREADEPLVLQAIRTGQTDWRDVGVIVEHEAPPSLPDGSSIDRHLLEELLRNVVATYMRTSPYDGFLLWFRD